MHKISTHSSTAQSVALSLHLKHHIWYIITPTSHDKLTTARSINSPSSLWFIAQIITHQNKKNKHGTAGKKPTQFTRLVNVSLCGKCNDQAPLQYVFNNDEGTSSESSWHKNADFSDGLQEQINTFENTLFYSINSSQYCSAGSSFNRKHVFSFRMCTSFLCLTCPACLCILLGCWQRAH